jgi:hypothetical protein
MKMNALAAAVVVCALAASSAHAATSARIVTPAVAPVSLASLGGAALASAPLSAPIAAPTLLAPSAPLADAPAVAPAAAPAAAHFDERDMRALLDSVPPAPQSAGVFGGGRVGYRVATGMEDDEDRGEAGAAVRAPRPPKPMPPSARALRIPAEVLREGSLRAVRFLSVAFDGARPARRAAAAEERELALAN